ncbi:serine/threonine protein kinase [Pseudenhygromyxa sp. WMMC2535]|uniref:protein kinase domain-containing protein n=1 Tax=Pseudenhygromyxa sp. WMMC2535 TaxID=2712867 RepID=UPI001556F5FF|nr:serine/threonine protein kinase [Pseudenhygromyxa sp. WMMC2535]
MTEIDSVPAGAGEDPFGVTLDADTDATPPPAPPVAGFEHRRAIASARARLFGGGPQLHIGRYRVDARLGAGGMGEVYLGHDAELGRKVALKRVRAEIGDALAQERLRREARALAKLSHPNVVQVYEIGEHERRTYLAMEFIDGQPLSRWLDALEGGRRRWRAVLDRFLAAGRGLAAAHHAGVIHRDFKPDNVLLGKDGGVRVVDFGLAVGSERAPLDGQDPVASPQATSEAPLGRLSAAGAVVGTIRYMPLEQLRGEEVDARSDQFSFCVALYEGLWGRPPFPPRSTSEHLAALEADAPRPPPKGKAPAGLWRAVRRGLSRDPRARWPSMAALLEALAALPRRRQRWAMGAGLAASFGIVVGAVALWPEDAIEPCAEIASELDGTWDAPRRAALTELYSRSALSHASDSRTRVLAALDAWSDEWVAARTDLCHDARAQRVETEVFARQRTACLLRQRARVGGLVDELLDPANRTAATLAAAVVATAELPSPSRCDAAMVAMGFDPPPAAIADEVAALDETIDAATELRLLGQLERGRETIATALARADALGYAPTRAEATAELAFYEFSAGEPLRAQARLHDAVDLAEASRHDRLAASLWTSMAMHAGAGQTLDPARAADHLRRASAAWARVEAPPEERARLAFARGQLAVALDDPETAALHLREALAELEERDSLERPAIHALLAEALRASDPEAALSELERALEDAERIWGPSHPETAPHVYNFALEQLRAGHPQRAEDLLERAADIWAQSLEHPHPNLANARSMRFELALRAGSFEEAEAEIEALDQALRELPEDDPMRASVETLRATLAGVRSRRAEALAHCERAIALLAPSVPASDPRLIHLRTESAAHLMAVGRLDEAAAIDRLLLAESALSPAAALPIHLGLAELELRQGALDAAEEALDAVEALALPSLGAHELSAALLRALLELRRGELSPARREAVHAALASTPFTAVQLEAWYEELALDPGERRALGLPRKP